MKVLICAYACEPNRGSEPGVGWKWALNLCNDQSQEVYVLTRNNNRNLIENYWDSNTKPKNLTFFYYDLPSVFVWAKHHGLPVNLYYAWWLIGAINYAKKLHKEYHFDYAHHLTFGVFRDPCPLYKLGTPYFIGPIGGGEQTPKGFASIYSYKQRLIEMFRTFANKFALYNPTLNKTFNKASLILSKTNETQQVLSKWHNKTHVSLEIGIEQVNRSTKNRDKECFIYVGRFIYWKGIKLVLESFRKYSSIHPNAQLLMIGKGTMEEYIKQYAQRNNLKINVIAWIQQEKLKQYYQSSSAMIFPSLHDSSGNVVLEALSFGLPVICLDCGGPATILGEELSECTVSTKDTNIDEVVDQIVEKMNKLSTNDPFYYNIQEKAYQRAESLIWRDTVYNTYQLAKKYCFSNDAL